MSTRYGPASFDVISDPAWGDPNSIINVNPEQLKNMMAQAQCAPPPVTKDSVANEIKATVCGPREAAYGEVEDNFGRIAKHWTAFLHNRFGTEHVANVCLTPADVAALMILLKVARLEYMPEHHDSWVDAGGYAVCGAVCAANG